jgi:hypothetical protein
MANRTIKVKGTEITVVSVKDEDYISLTDMVKAFEDSNSLIEAWLRNKDTVNFLAVWEKLNNPSFNSLEFEGIRYEAGTNKFTLSAKKFRAQRHCL